MQNYIRDGRCIDITPTADVIGGDIVVLPGMIAIASTDIPAGVTGSAVSHGVFALPKAAEDLAQGARVYLAAAVEGEVTTYTATATAGAIFAGIAWASAASADDVVQVNINFGAPVAAADA